MGKHIYFHIGKLEYIKYLNGDPSFEISPEYECLEMGKRHRNEYGRLKSNGNFYHILVGQMQQEGCPWCGSPAKIIKLECTSRAIGFSAYCIQCVGCSSRGPVLNLRDEDCLSEKFYEEGMDILLHRYKTRRTWDVDFVNPYE